MLRFHFKDAILEGEIPFNKAHGVHAFEYHGKDSRMNGLFNKAMQNVTCIDMKRVLECYNGFEGVKEIIDVGGGLGISLASIISKYPNIKGINFDLPHVIKDAPTYEGNNQNHIYYALFFLYYQVYWLNSGHIYSCVR